MQVDFFFSKCSISFMSKNGTSRESITLKDVPCNSVVELLGFKDGKELGIGLRGVVRSRYTQLLPRMNLQRRVRLELLFGDGRELSYPESFEVYCLGSERDFINSRPQPIVPGLRPLKVLVR